MQNIEEYTIESYCRFCDARLTNPSWDHFLNTCYSEKCVNTKYRVKDGVIIYYSFDYENKVITGSMVNNVTSLSLMRKIESVDSGSYFFNNPPVIPQAPPVPQRPYRASAAPPVSPKVAGPTGPVGSNNTLGVSGYTFVPGSPYVLGPTGTYSSLTNTLPITGSMGVTGPAGPFPKNLFSAAFIPVNNKEDKENMIRRFKNMEIFY